MLITSRCALRGPTSADVAAIMALMTRPDVRRYLGGPVSPEHAAAVAAGLAEENDPRAWAVHLRRHQAVGCVGLIQIAPHHDDPTFELSYAFLPIAWGFGFASESVRAVIGHAFGSLGITRLLAETQAANRPSRLLLERVGMQHERDLKRFGEMQALYAMRKARSGAA